MSHTTEIKSIGIRDIDALRKAVAQLQKEGVKCELLENEKPRMYSSGQYKASTGREKADYVLKLHNSNYDLGFTAEYTKDEFGNQVVDQYSIQTDFWSGHVEREIGFPQTADMKGDNMRLGRLTQAYTRYAAENQMVSQGYSLNEFDITTDAQGTLHMSFVQMQY